MGKVTKIKETYNKLSKAALSKETTIIECKSCRTCLLVFDWHEPIECLDCGGKTKVICKIKKWNDFTAAQLERISSVILHVNEEHIEEYSDEQKENIDEIRDSSIGEDENVQ